MIHYRSLGELPPKPHFVFESGGKMLAEHVFTRDGFNDAFGILYQNRAPTHETRAALYETQNRFFCVPSTPPPPLLKRRHIPNAPLPKGGTLLESRFTLFCNSDVSIGVAKPTQVEDVFFANSDADELFFVAGGTGVLETPFGALDYGPDDYLFIPKAIPYRFVFSDEQHFLCTEAYKNLSIPKEFRNPVGQLRLDAPGSHRDFRSPTRLIDFSGRHHAIVIKRHQTLTIHEYTEWPYQTRGWDGFVYPFAFNINNYQPKTSTVHLPPTIHLCFSAPGFVVLNFVPRLVDYHDKAIPCPYPHSSPDCDEVIFYAKGNFTSRKAISQHSFSCHPGGLPHGPHPEKYEESVGTQKTNELAIMVDTFAPLGLAPAVAQFEDSSYHGTWNTTQFL